MAIEDIYLELAEKHELPDYHEFNKEFEISSIDTEEFLLREIRRKMMERFDYYAKILQELFQPDPHSSSIFEAKNFTDKDRENIFNLYSKIMAMMRHSVVVSLDNSDEQNAKFINSSYKEWLRIKEKVLPIAMRIKSTWENHFVDKIKAEYFG
ncbi:hypothetical protein DRJ17_02590 [Candidatus Woesearchaeota archaeon]|nr:MAG: hypothetical protein DRJ17_02590 [Candidatus Woesearchaeota archaeon]